MSAAPQTASQSRPFWASRWTLDAPPARRAILARMAEKFGSLKSRTHRGKKRPYLCFGRHGKVYSFRGLDLTPERAETVLGAIRAAVAQGTPKREAVEKWRPANSAPNRVERWVGEWLEDLTAQVAAGERSETYIRELRAWTNPESRRGYLVPLFKHSIYGLDYQTLRQWQRVVSEHGVTGKSLWNVTGAVSAFLSWLVQMGQLQVKPAIPWPRYDEHVPKIIRPEHQDAILEAVPEIERGAFLAMATLGLRHSEAWVVDGRDVRQGWVWIRHARKGRRLDSPVRGTKNREAKVLPIPAVLHAWIDRHVPKRTLLEGGIIFPNPRTGSAWTPTSFRRAWMKALRTSGLELGVNSYEAFKHSTATEWLRRGATEREIQELLGHKDAKSTRKYAKLANERLAEVVESRRTK